MAAVAEPTDSSVRGNVSIAFDAVRARGAVQNFKSVEHERGVAVQYARVALLLAAHAGLLPRGRKLATNHGPPLGGRGRLRLSVGAAR